MDSIELLDIISCGETSKVQFKCGLSNIDSIASEIIAFSNTTGGMLIFGVEDKTGKILGLDYTSIQHISNVVSNISTERIKPLIYITTEVVICEIEDSRNHILIVHISEGLSKPYKDNNGTIWIKQGADKRKLTDNGEIIRLFQQSGIIFVDEMVVPHSSINDVDSWKVREYLKKIVDIVDENISDYQLYNNINILKKDRLTLAGLLFFGKEPQSILPTFCIKAVSFWGNSIGGTSYRDSRDIYGTLPELFDNGISFFTANLKHIQLEQNFNSMGVLEISQIALEELLQNALLHRDYTKNAPIRLIIFDNRIEIISPGKLPNSLTVENIKYGNSVVRNNLLTSFGSRLMKYRGFGSGIIRALSNQPNIEFINDVEGDQFIVKIPRIEQG